MYIYRVSTCRTGIRALCLGLVCLLLVQDTALATLNSSHINNREEVPVKWDLIENRFVEYNVKDSFRGDSKQPVVFLMQDAHGLYSHQKALAEKIQSIQNDFSTELVLFEGSHETLHVADLRNFPDQSILKEVTDRYAQEGLLSAVELAAIFSKKNADWIGLENKRSYQRNHDLYAPALVAGTVLRNDWLQSTQQELEAVLESRFSEKQRKWVNILMRKNKSREIETWLQEFLKLSIERGIKAEQYPTLEILSKRSKKDHVGPIEANDPTASVSQIMIEIDLYCQEVQAQLFSEEKEEQLLKALLFTEYLSRFSQLRVARGEWQQWQAAINEGTAQVVLERVLNESISLPDEEILKLVEFYASAVERENYFFKNLKRRIRQKKAESAIVITGGFHTQGLEDRLQASQISYVVIPVISQEPIRAEENHYKRLMREGFSSRDEAFSEKEKNVFFPRPYASGQLFRLWKNQTLDELFSSGRSLRVGRELRDLNAFEIKLSRLYQAATLHPGYALLGPDAGAFRLSLFRELFVRYLAESKTFAGMDDLLSERLDPLQSNGPSEKESSFDRFYERAQNLKQQIVDSANEKTSIQAIESSPSAVSSDVIKGLGVQRQNRIDLLRQGKGIIERLASVQRYSQRRLHEWQGYAENWRVASSLGLPMSKEDKQLRKTILKYRSMFILNRNEKRYQAYLGIFGSLKSIVMLGSLASLLPLFFLVDYFLSGHRPMLSLGIRLSPLLLLATALYLAGNLTFKIMSMIEARRLEPLEPLTDEGVAKLREWLNIHKDRKSLEISGREESQELEDNLTIPSIAYEIQNEMIAYWESSNEHAFELSEFVGQLAKEENLKVKIGEVPTRIEALKRVDRYFKILKNVMVPRSSAWHLVRKIMSILPPLDDLQRNYLAVYLILKMEQFARKHIEALKDQGVKLRELHPRPWDVELVYGELMGKIDDITIYESQKHKGITFEWVFHFRATDLHLAIIKRYPNGVRKALEPEDLLQEDGLKHLFRQSTLEIYAKGIYRDLFEGFREQALPAPEGKKEPKAASSLGDLELVRKKQNVIEKTLANIQKERLAPGSSDLPRYLIVTDLHGNAERLKQMMDYASENQITAIILGGDIYTGGGGHGADIYHMLVDWKKRKAEGESLPDIKLTWGNHEMYLARALMGDQRRLRSMLTVPRFGLARMLAGLASDETSKNHLQTLSDLEDPNDRNAYLDQYLEIFNLIENDSSIQGFLKFLRQEHQLYFKDPIYDSLIIHAPLELSQTGDVLFSYGGKKGLDLLDDFYRQIQDPEKSLREIAHIMDFLDQPNSPMLSNFLLQSPKYFDLALSSQGVRQMIHGHMHPAIESERGLDNFVLRFKDGNVPIDIGGGQRQINVATLYEEDDGGFVTLGPDGMRFYKFEGESGRIFEAGQKEGVAQPFIAPADHLDNLEAYLIDRWVEVSRDLQMLLSRQDEQRLNVQEYERVLALQQGEPTLHPGSVKLAWVERGLLGILPNIWDERIRGSLITNLMKSSREDTFLLLLKMLSVLLDQAELYRDYQSLEYQRIKTNLKDMVEILAEHLQMEDHPQSWSADYLNLNYSESLKVRDFLKDYFNRLLIDQDSDIAFLGVAKILNVPDEWYLGLLDKALLHPANAVRLGAADAMIVLGSKSLDRVVSHLDHPDHYVRLLALHVIKQIAKENVSVKERVVALIQSKLETESDWMIQRMGFEFLRSLGQEVLQGPGEARDGLNQAELFFNLWDDFLKQVGVGDLSGLKLFNILMEPRLMTGVFLAGARWGQIELLINDAYHLQFSGVEQSLTQKLRDIWISAGNYASTKLWSLKDGLNGNTASVGRDRSLGEDKLRTYYDQPDGATRRVDHSALAQLQEFWEGRFEHLDTVGTLPLGWQMHLDPENSIDDAEALAAMHLYFLMQSDGLDDAQKNLLARIHAVSAFQEIFLHEGNLYLTQDEFEVLHGLTDIEYPVDPLFFSPAQTISSSTRKLLEIDAKLWSTGDDISILPSWLGSETGVNVHYFSNQDSVEADFPKDIFEAVDMSDEKIEKWARRLQRLFSPGTVQWPQHRQELEANEKIIPFVRYFRQGEPSFYLEASGRQVEVNVERVGPLFYLVVDSQHTEEYAQVAKKIEQKLSFLPNDAARYFMITTRPDYLTKDQNRLSYYTVEAIVAMLSQLVSIKNENVFVPASGNGVLGITALRLGAKWVGMVDYSANLTVLAEKTLEISNPDLLEGSLGVGDFKVWTADLQSLEMDRRYDEEGLPGKVTTIILNLGFWGIYQEIRPINLTVLETILTWPGVQDIFSGGYAHDPEIIADLDGIREMMTRFGFDYHYSRFVPNDSYSFIAKRERGEAKTETFEIPEEIKQRLGSDYHYRLIQSLEAEGRNALEGFIREKYRFTLGGDDETEPVIFASHESERPHEELTLMARDALKNPPWEVDGLIPVLASVYEMQGDWNNPEHVASWLAKSVNAYLDNNPLEGDLFLPQALPASGKIVLFIKDMSVLLGLLDLDGVQELPRAVLRQLNRLTEQGNTVLFALPDDFNTELLSAQSLGAHEEEIVSGRVVILTMRTQALVAPQVHESPATKTHLDMTAVRLQRERRAFVDFLAQESLSDLTAEQQKFLEPIVDLLAGYFVGMTFLSHQWRRKWNAEIRRRVKKEYPQLQDAWPQAVVILDKWALQYQRDTSFRVRHESRFAEASARMFYQHVREQDLSDPIRSASERDVQRKKTLVLGAGLEGILWLEDQSRFNSGGSLVLVDSNRFVIQLLKHYQTMMLESSAQIVESDLSESQELQEKLQGLGAPKAFDFISLSRVLHELGRVYPGGDETLMNREHQVPLDAAEAVAARQAVYQFIGQSLDASGRARVMEFNSEQGFPVDALKVELGQAPGLIVEMVTKISDTVPFYWVSIRKADSLGDIQLDAKHRLYLSRLIWKEALLAKGEYEIEIKDPFLLQELRQLVEARLEKISRRHHLRKQSRLLELEILRMQLWDRGEGSIDWGSLDRETERFFLNTTNVADAPNSQNIILDAGSIPLNYNDVWMQTFLASLGKEGRLVLLTPKTGDEALRASNFMAAIPAEHRNKVFRISYLEGEGVPIDLALAKLFQDGRATVGLMAQFNEIKQEHVGSKPEVMLFQIPANQMPSMVAQYLIKEALAVNLRQRIPDFATEVTAKNARWVSFNLGKLLENIHSQLQEASALDQAA